MEIIAVILLIFPEVYVLGIFIFLFSQHKKKRVLPKKLLIYNVFILLIFVALKYLILGHMIDFTGEYVEDDKFWEEAMGNMFVTYANLLIIFLALLLSQAIFGILFRKESIKLNSIRQ